MTMSVGAYWKNVGHKMQTTYIPCVCAHMLVKPYPVNRGRGKQRRKKKLKKKEKKAGEGVEQRIVAKTKKRFRSKNRKSSKKGFGHQAPKATSQEAVTKCSIPACPELISFQTERN